MGEFARAPGYTLANPHWYQVMAQADYLLSTRTAVHLEAVYQLAGGGNGNRVFNADVYNLTQSTGNKQLALAAGLRHRSGCRSEPYEYASSEELLFNRISQWRTVAGHPLRHRYNGTSTATAR
jgi:hypothetical protein